LTDALKTGQSPVEVGGLLSFAPAARRRDGSMLERVSNAFELRVQEP
jgi:hypothetical protein